MADHHAQAGPASLLRDARRVECGDVAQGPYGALHDRQREQCAGALTEPQIEVDERAKAEMIHGDGVAGFG